MFLGKSVALILPARNEALALPSVLGTVPAAVDSVIVVDNGSTDDTPHIASALGARVVAEPRAGYGRACIAGLQAMDSRPPDIVAFADADGSDDLSALDALLAPLASGDVDLMLGSRLSTDRNAFSWQQRIGNWIVTRLVALFWGHAYADLGPMRAITWQALQRLNMGDQNYGWTVEMQIRALKKGLRVREFCVSYKKRIAGQSKVSRSLSGSLKAGAKMLWVIAREMARSFLMKLRKGPYHRPKRAAGS